MQGMLTATDLNIFVVRLLRKSGNITVGNCKCGCDLYGCDTWLLKPEVNRLKVYQHKVFRTIFEPKKNNNGGGRLEKTALWGAL
jgi:hypothetical protein